MNSIIILFLLQSGLFAGPEGYRLTDSHIFFTYPSAEKNLEVFVSGNFNGWSKESEWKMTFEVGKGYVLSKPIDAVRKPGSSFYEFTFRVNGKLIDANKDASNVIHCAGYGSRYLIHF